MNNGNRTILVLTAALVMALAMVSNVQANPAEGTNPVLNNPSFSGDIFVPLRTANSGTLTLGGIGTVSDSVTLSGNGTTATGFLMFSLTFDISGEINPLAPDIVSGNLLLRFQDMDFRETNVASTFLYRESLSVAYDGNEALELNNTNFENYAEGIPPIATNNTTVVYNLDMRGDLGLDDADFAQISADKVFTINMIWRTHTTHIRTGTHTLRNTAEKVDLNDFTFASTPEPATLVLLSAGGLAMLRRRNK